MKRHHVVLLVMSYFFVHTVYGLELRSASQLGAGNVGVSSPDLLSSLFYNAAAVSALCFDEGRVARKKAKRKNRMYCNSFLLQVSANKNFLSFAKSIKDIMSTSSDSKIVQELVENKNKRANANIALSYTLLTPSAFSFGLQTIVDYSSYVGGGIFPRLTVNSKVEQVVYMSYYIKPISDVSFSLSVKPYYALMYEGKTNALVFKDSKEELSPKDSAREGWGVSFDASVYVEKYMFYNHVLRGGVSFHDIVDLQLGKTTFINKQNKTFPDKKKMSMDLGLSYDIPNLIRFLNMISLRAGYYKVFDTVDAFSPIKLGLKTRFFKYVSTSIGWYTGSWTAGFGLLFPYLKLQYSAFLNKKSYQLFDQSSLNHVVQLSFDF